MIRLMIIAFIFQISFAFAGSKSTLNLNGANGKVEFHAIGRPSALKIHGKGAAPKGSITIDNGIVSGKVTFELSSLETGIKLRDQHMKNKYLEVEKFPLANLSFNKLKITEFSGPNDFSKDSVPFEGTLTVHGVEHAITGKANVRKKGSEVAVDAEFATRVSDHKIDVPSFSGITMADEVQVQVSFSAPLAN